MSALSHIFTPLATKPNLTFEDFTIVAFDTDGTLTLSYSANKPMAAFYEALWKNKIFLGLERVAIISSDVRAAHDALRHRGLEHIAGRYIQQKSDFYDRANALGKKIIVIDDDPIPTTEKMIAIQARAKHVEDALARRHYEAFLTARP